MTAPTVPAGIHATSPGGYDLATCPSVGRSVKARTPPLGEADLGVRRAVVDLEPLARLALGTTPMTDRSNVPMGDDHAASVADDDGGQMVATPATHVGRESMS
jgi:hypothetical protein